MLMVKDTAALKNGDKVVTSSQIVKVKITKNVPRSFNTIVYCFCINSRYSNGSILSSVSIVSYVLFQVM